MCIRVQSEISLRIKQLFENMHPMKIIKVLCIQIINFILVNSQMERNRIPLVPCFSVHLLSSRHVFYYNGSLLAQMNKGFNWAAQLIHPTVECIFTLEAPRETRIIARMNNLIIGGENRWIFEPRQDPNHCFDGAIRIYDVAVGGEMNLQLAACQTAPELPQVISTLNSLVITATLGNGEFELDIEIMHPNSSSQRQTQPQEMANYNYDNSYSDIFDEGEDNMNLLSEISDNSYPYSGSTNSSGFDITNEPSLGTGTILPNSTSTSITIPTPNGSNNPTQTSLMRPTPPSNTEMTTQEISSYLGLPTKPPINNTQPQVNEREVLSNENIPKQQISLPPLENNFSTEADEENLSEEIDTTTISNSKTTEFSIQNNTNQEQENQYELQASASTTISMPTTVLDNIFSSEKENIESSTNEEKEKFEEIDNELTKNDKISSEELSTMNLISAALVGGRNRPSSRIKHPISKERNENDKPLYKYHIVISKNNLKASSLHKAPSGIFQRDVETYT